MAHPFNSSAWKSREEDGELQVSLGYTTDPISKDLKKIPKSLFQNYS